MGTTIENNILTFSLEDYRVFHIGHMQMICNTNLYFCKTSGNAMKRSLFSIPEVFSKGLVIMSDSTLYRRYLIVLKDCTIPC